MGIEEEMEMPVAVMPISQKSQLSFQREIAFDSGGRMVTYLCASLTHFFPDRSHGYGYGYCCQRSFSHWELAATVPLAKALKLLPPPHLAV